MLLLAQLATSYLRGIALLVLLLGVSIVTVERMETYPSTVPSRPPVAPRDLEPLVATLDRAGIDRVYADFWLSYRLTFETDERIVAAQSKLERVGLVGGRALAARHPSIRHRPYERTVEASRHAFVYFRSSLETGADRTPGPEADARVDQLRTFVSKLEGYGYRRVEVDPFVVYAPPSDGSP